MRTCFYVDDNIVSMHAVGSRREQPGRLLAAAPSVCSSAEAVDLWIYATTKRTKRPCVNAGGWAVHNAEGQGWQGAMLAYGAFEVLGSAFTPTPTTSDS